ncbi:AEC family transporter [Paracoccus tegillarcae]|nr:AEC family transporter [Paracoccus tegillarcae]
MPIISAVLPVILVIATGYAVRAGGLVPRDAWSGVERLAYRLLFPAMLISAIAPADLGRDTIGRFGLTLLGVLALAVLALMAMRWLLPPERLPNPQFTSLFQAVTRWNGFIALAIAALLTGSQGITLISVGMAVMIPTINVANIIILAAYGPQQRTAAQIAAEVLRNPLVQGCLIGIALNLAGNPLPDAVMQALEMIGRAALAVGIMAVGAAIQPRRLLSIAPVLWAGVGLRLIGMPGLFLIAGKLVGLGTDALVAGTLAMAVPAAANGYIMARQMNGDAELYADILTWQTVLSALTIPFWLWLALPG